MNAESVKIFPKLNPQMDDPAFDDSHEIKEARNKLIEQGQLGSFGIRMDSQLHSLRRVKEEKEFAKAVKSDDAEVPIYLWNERVDIPTFTNEKRDRVLKKLRAVGHRFFV